MIAMLRASEGLTESEAAYSLRAFGDKYAFRWHYGHIKYDSPVIPHGYSFIVTFVEGRVARTHDPFDGRLSSDGKPTTPKLMLPAQHALFKHSPRFVDMRWQPSSGVYPMEYELEVSSGQVDLDERKVQFNYYGNAVHHSKLPHLSIAFGGSDGRWRVRAKNRLGESDWSAERYFEFVS
ncbi:MAG TPA: hypothetical protein VGX76_04100 [Pirellulales bacterium]|nr:hypothetical protein [Pirellulales bacterium]